MLVYDVTNEKSLLKIKHCIKDIDQVSKTFLICNVCYSLNL